MLFLVINAYLSSDLQKRVSSLPLMRLRLQPRYLQTFFKVPERACFDDQVAGCCQQQEPEEVAAIKTVKDDFPFRRQRASPTERAQFFTLGLHGSWKHGETLNADQWDL